MYFQGKLEVDQNLKKVEENLKKARISEVRKQEKEFSKKLLNTAKEKIDEIQMSNCLNTKYDEYIQKQEEIKRLLSLKSQFMETIGESHRSAQEISISKAKEFQMKYNLELEEKEKAIARYNEAKGWLKVCYQNQNGFQEEIIKKKKSIIENESIKAHELAIEYRLAQEALKLKMEEEVEKTKNEKGDKNLFYSKKVKKNVYSQNIVDYSSTYFHNNKITKHDQEIQIENADNLAKSVAIKRNEERKKKEEKRKNIKEQSQIRSKKAIQEENDRKEKLEFLKKLQKEFTIKIPQNQNRIIKQSNEAKLEHEFKKEILNSQKILQIKEKKIEDKSRTTRSQSSIKGRNNKRKIDNNHNIAGNKIDKCIDLYPEVSDSPIIKEKTNELVDISSNEKYQNSYESSHQNTKENNFLNISSSEFEESKSGNSNSNIKISDQGYKFNRAKSFNNRKSQLSVSSSDTESDDEKGYYEEKSNLKINNFIEDSKDGSKKLANNEEDCNELLSRAKNLVQQFLKSPEEEDESDSSDSDLSFSVSEKSYHNSDKFERKSRDSQKFEFMSRDNSVPSDANSKYRSHSSREKVSKTKFEMIGKSFTNSESKSYSEQEEYQNDQIPSKKAVKFEIKFDDSPKKPLSEAFQAKFGERRNRMSLSTREVSQEPKNKRSKEEILEIRKKMMQRPGLKGKENESPLESNINPELKLEEDRISKLQARLAKGEKVEISKKEMKTLTQKNYKNLPEVAKMKAEAQKKEDLKRRLELKKEYDMKVRSKLKKSN